MGVEEISDDAYIRSMRIKGIKNLRSKCMQHYNYGTSLTTQFPRTFPTLNKRIFLRTPFPEGCSYKPQANPGRSYLSYADRKSTVVAKAFGTKLRVSKKVDSLRNNCCLIFISSLPLSQLTLISGLRLRDQLDFLVLL